MIELWLAGELVEQQGDKATVLERKSQSRKFLEDKSADDSCDGIL